MTPRHDWKALVADHARATGAADLPLHTIDELAAHLEDIYIAKRAAGRVGGRCAAGRPRGARGIAARGSSRSRTHPVESRAPVPAAPAQRLHRPGRRPPVRVAAAASQPVVCRSRDRHARARRRRRDRDLQHRRHRAAAAASLPAAGAARRDLGDRTPRRRCRRSGCRRSISWTTAASAPCSRTRPPGGGPRSICRSPAPNRSA